MLISALALIVVLGPLIFVHELGHFLVAKLFKVKVLKFSIGFGTPLYSKTIGETEYIIAALPLGGYVKMYGEHEDEKVDPEEQHRSFSHKPVSNRMAVVAAGPAFNILFAFFIFFGIFYFKGLPEDLDTPLVGSVVAESPASQAGLKTGDMIISINGEEISAWSRIPELVQGAGGAEMTLIVKRGEEEHILKMTPEFKRSKDIFGQEAGEPRYLLGIGKGEDYVFRDAGLGECVQASLITTWRVGHIIFQAIVKLIERVIPASQLTGPISIAETAGQRMQQGVTDLLYFMALLSVNLGILNLLPIPVLDGGHLVFFTIEGIFRKPLHDSVMGVAQRIGIILLGALMLFAFYNDIVNLVHKWMAP